jgi:hypothetical protein
MISWPECPKAYGIAGWPSKYLVGASGKVVWNDHFGITEAMVEEQLKNVLSYPQLEYSKKFDGALKLVKSGDYGNAAAELAKLETEPGADGENAKTLEKWIDDEGQKRVAEGDAAKDAGDIFGSRDIYAEVEKRWAAKSECVKSAKTKGAALKTDKDTKKVLAQEKTYQEARVCERLGDKAGAAKMLAKCAAACKGTKFAEVCDAEAKKLSGK